LTEENCKADERVDVTRRDGDFNEFLKAEKEERKLEGGRGIRKSTRK